MAQVERGGWKRCRARAGSRGPAVVLQEPTEPLFTDDAALGERQDRRLRLPGLGQRPVVERLVRVSGYTA
jgi:hypothetical protein